MATHMMAVGMICRQYKRMCRLILSRVIGLRSEISFINVGSFLENNNEMVRIGMVTTHNQMMCTPARIVGRIAQ
jgi:hypothetical protein